MNIANIKKLVKLVETSQINELEVQDENLQIRIVKNAALSPSVMQPQVIHASGPPVHSAAEHPTQIQEAHLEISSASGKENLIEVRSPMVGTFYRAPAPDAASYVNEGDSIKPGQILCIIEAMKLMNEIEAEISGKIVKICVENGQPVEYNQPLFMVEKAS
ncbi:acetyl-CoA carboxylase biotin carboxyl carrier protein [bacterium]|nr:acetyl-CoA carboxylase biotin carboxyl carrier protein [bacterium]